jgi:hypothetical protein
MRRRHQPTLTPSPSTSSGDGSDIESCIDTGDEEATDADTESTDFDTDVDGENEVDLPDPEWLGRGDNANTDCWTFTLLLIEMTCQIWPGSLERRTLIRQSTTSIKRTILTNPRMKMRTIVNVVSSSLT